MHNPTCVESATNITPHYYPAGSYQPLPLVEALNSANVTVSTSNPNDMLIGLVAADGGGCTRDGRILTPWQGAGPGFTLIAPLVPGPLGCANSGAPYSQNTGICGTAAEFEVVASPQSEVRIIFPWNDPEPGLAVHSTLPATRSFVSPEQYSFVTGTGWVMVGDAVCGEGSLGCITGPATVVPEYPLGLPVLAILTIIAYAAIKRRTTKKPN